MGKQQRPKQTAARTLAERVATITPDPVARPTLATRVELEAAAAACDDLALTLRRFAEYAETHSDTSTEEYTGVRAVVLFIGQDLIQRLKPLWLRL